MNPRGKGKYKKGGKNNSPYELNLYCTLCDVWVPRGSSCQPNHGPKWLRDHGKRRSGLKDLEGRSQKGMAITLLILLALFPQAASHPVPHDPVSGPHWVAGPGGDRRIFCSGSMEPAFGCRDRLLLVPAYNKNLSAGDIVWYKADWFRRGFVAHRIANVTKDGYTLKGDANPWSDPGPVKRHLITMKVAAIYKDIGGEWIKRLCRRMG